MYISLQINLSHQIKNLMEITEILLFFLIFSDIIFPDWSKLPWHSHFPPFSSALIFPCFPVLVATLQNGNLRKISTIRNVYDTGREIFAIRQYKHARQALSYLKVGNSRISVPIWGIIITGDGLDTLFLHKNCMREMSTNDVSSEL